MKINDVDPKAAGRLKPRYDDPEMNHAVDVVQGATMPINSKIQADIIYAQQQKRVVSDALLAREEKQELIQPRDLEYWGRAMKLAAKIIGKARSDRKFEKHEILALCLASRIQNSSSAVKLLVEQHLIHDAKAVLRTLAEALILLAGALNKEDFMDLYYGQELERKKRITNKMVRGGVWNQAEFTQERIEAIKKTNEDLKRYKAINLGDLADESGLKLEYYYIHNACSGEVHHLPHTMEKYIQVDQRGKTVHFIAYPELEDSQLLICEAYSCTLKMAKYVNDHFKIGMESSIEALSTEGRSWFDKGET